MAIVQKLKFQVSLLFSMQLMEEKNLKGEILKLFYFFLHPTLLKINKSLEGQLKLLIRL